jgi:plastocyanin
VGVSQRKSIIHPGERDMKSAFSFGVRNSLRLVPLALAFGAVFGMSSIYAAVGSPASTVSLDIAKFAFAPKDVTVTPGTKIVWTNRDDTPHTVVSNDKSFASKGLDTDDKFEHTFTTEGDFNYVCTVHPFMTGVVHVRKQ